MTIKEDPPRTVALSKLSWDLPRELWLCDMAYAYRNLWKLYDEKDVTQEDMRHFATIRVAMNNHFCTEYTDKMVMRKWMELVLLFGIKYACNGHTVELRGHHIRRDGTLKDDLNESWKLFNKLQFLAQFHWTVLQANEKEEAKLKKIEEHVASQRQLLIHPKLINFPN